MGLATDRLARTIDNLVNFATFEGGGHAVHREPFDCRRYSRPFWRGSGSRPNRAASTSTEGRDARAGVRRPPQAAAGALQTHRQRHQVRPARERDPCARERRPDAPALRGVRPGRRPLAGEGEKVFRPLLPRRPVGDERAPAGGSACRSPRRSSRPHGGHIWSRARPRTSRRGATTFLGGQVAFWIPMRRAPRAPSPQVPRASDSRRPA